MADLLILDRLVVRRGKRFSLEPTSLTLTEESGVVGLFGQNGAGKTTLLKATAGLIDHHAGDIRTRNGRTPVFLPDRPYLYDFLRVDETPRLLSRYYDDYSVEIADQVIDDLGLDRSQRVAHLSKGMSEQLSLGLMLARRADVYLFDEPLAAVDPVTRDVVLSLIQRHRPEDSTVVISTHLISGLESLFDEFAILHEGRLLLHEPVGTLLRDGGLEETFKKVVRGA